MWANFLDNINPTTYKSPAKIVNIICLFLGAVLIVYSVKEYQLIKSVLTDKDAIWDLNITWSFLPLPSLSLIIFLLYKKNKIGWTLIMILVTMVLVETILSFTSTALKMGTPNNDLFQTLFRKKELNTYLTVTLFYGSLLYYFNTIQIKDLFSISSKRQSRTIGLTAFAIIFLWLVFMV